MKLIYDAETDSGMLLFRDEAATGGNSEVSENVYLMYNDRDEVIGIEVTGGAAEFFKLKDRNHSVERELLLV